MKHYETNKLSIFPLPSDKDSYFYRIWAEALEERIANKIINRRTKMTDKSPIEELKQRMVENFLRWRLPKDFNPDGGIEYKDKKFVCPSALTGTNLFTYEQAREMVDFMLTGTSTEEQIPAMAHGALPEDIKKREEHHRKSVEAAKGIQKSFEELGRKQEQMEYEELVKRIERLEAMTMMIR